MLAELDDRKLVVSTGVSSTVHHEVTLTACHDTCCFRVCTLHAARCHGGKRFNVCTLLMQCLCEKDSDVAVCYEVAGLWGMRRGWKQQWQPRVLLGST